MKWVIYTTERAILKTHECRKSNYHAITIQDKNINARISKKCLYHWDITLSLTLSLSFAPWKRVNLLSLSQPRFPYNRICCAHKANLFHFSP